MFESPKWKSIYKYRELKPKQFSQEFFLPVVKVGNQSNSKSSKSKSTKGKNPFETDEEEETKKTVKKASKSALPRPSPPKSKNKLTPARSLESVPITVNSHIPASPLRPSVGKKRVTSEMATQVEGGFPIEINTKNKIS